MDVLRQEDDEWVVVARDWDPETRFRWRRTGGPLSPMSEVDLEWRVPDDVAPGTYRILYRGDARSLGGVITPISGVSPLFTVN